MIDINELRRLALDGDLAAMQEIIHRLDAAEKSDAESIAMYRKARDERDALRAEIEELHALIAAVKRQARAEFCLRVKKEEEYVRLQAKINTMEKRLRLILEEPENTLSNSKALREVIRQAKLALEESK